jgi:pimeloyl-ACP methyl ester carboxylesterase
MGDLQCGTLVVPLDYPAVRGRPTLPIAVVRHPAEDPASRIGSLVIDPGGPGVSGIDDMTNELDTLTPQLLDDFDIVMFDPRGVERSDPVECDQSPGQEPTPTDPVPTTPAQVHAMIASFEQFAADCERTVPTLLPYVGTVDVARDLDLLRQALGDSGLTYMGQSYGTLLGLTYAKLFPTHVRAMVLDGVIDPALSFTQMSEQQAVGFESALQSFFSWCAATPSCPWRPSGDPTTSLLDQIEASAAHPAPAGGGQSAGPAALYDALLDGLYSRNEWPQLAETLAAEAAGNGSQASSMSEHYAQDGSSNGAVAATAIDCLDHPVSRNLATYPALASSLEVSAPVFGPLLAWGEATCAVWPVRATRTVGPVRAAGAPPILLVGTTGDPATPYSWALNVSHELARSSLLTVDGQNHVAYFYSACVRAPPAPRDRTGAAGALMGRCRR